MLVVQDSCAVAGWPCWDDVPCLQVAAYVAQHFSLLSARGTLSTLPAELLEELLGGQELVVDCVSRAGGGEGRGLGEGVRGGRMDPYTSQGGAALGPGPW